MHLTGTDKDAVERIRGNRATFTAQVEGLTPPGLLDYAEWCGTFAFNAGELLGIIDRLTAPELVPSGTGWPVQP